MSGQNGLQNLSKTRAGFGISGLEKFGFNESEKEIGFNEKNGLIHRNLSKLAHKLYSSVGPGLNQQ